MCDLWLCHNTGTPLESKFMIWWKLVFCRLRAAHVNSEITAYSSWLCTLHPFTFHWKRSMVYLWKSRYRLPGICNSGGILALLYLWLWEAHSTTCLVISVLLPSFFLLLPPGGLVVRHLAGLSMGGLLSSTNFWRYITIHSCCMKTENNTEIPVFIWHL
jgi:hypothetical protein